MHACMHACMQGQCKTDGRCPGGTCGIIGTCQEPMFRRAVSTYLLNSGGKQKMFRQTHHGHGHARRSRGRQEQQGAGLLSPVCLPVALCSSVFFASARPSTCPFVRPSVRPSAGPSVRPSVASSFFLYFRPSVRRSLDWLVRRSLGPSGQARSQPRACVTWRRVTSASTRDARGCVRGCL